MHKEEKKLKKGWSTGANACAAACAALRHILTNKKLDQIEILLPKCNHIFDIQYVDKYDQAIEYFSIKDAGDDPDVTHGAKIYSKVLFKQASEFNINFNAGIGVGTVTKNGLPLPVGEPAINPMPRKYITDNVIAVLNEFNVNGIVDITVSVENGEEIAKKTWNPKLGIIGGISILGTTGIVIPYSCSAWIHSIHRGIDVAKAEGIDTVVGCTGKTSENTALKTIGFHHQQIIDMGDFVGGMLKYINKNPINNTVIVGGFGKITKLAQGKTNLHSKYSQVDMNDLADLSFEIHNDELLYEKTKQSSTALEALTHNGKILATKIALRAKNFCNAFCGSSTTIRIVIIDRKGEIIADTK